MKFHGLDQFQEWLVNNGFTISENAGRSDYNEADWNACRRLTSARECETNGSKVLLWIKPYAYSGINYAACEVVIIGEASGLWFELKVYVVKPDELMRRLPEIEAKLVAAWNALMPNELSRRRADFRPASVRSENQHSIQPADFLTTRVDDAT